MFDKKNYAKNYAQTYRGKMFRKIAIWKLNGLIAINYEIIFDRYYYSSHCENCKCEYTKDNVKCMDHDHKNGLFRNILCNACNVNLMDTNTSGIPNISWDKFKNGWHYQKIIKGKKHTKRHKSLEWLKNYKKEYEDKHYYIH